MKRNIYIFLFVVIFLQEVIIAMYVKDQFLRPYGGDIIVEWLMYCFVRIFYTKKYKALPFYIFLFSVGIEITQYFKLVDVLGWGDNAVACAVMGTSFAWADIVCYAIGWVSILLGQEIWKMRQRKKRTPQISKR
ncbi:MAG: DUF2809 domain-containing protein [Bacteroidales bacterium]|nr:DUF2809 domain-containing protein [Candidatus Scybalocola fimicaballi]